MFRGCYGFEVMPDAQSRKIIHVDMDAFYASVEQRDDPKLRGRPVAVGHAQTRRGGHRKLRGSWFRGSLRHAGDHGMRRCAGLVFVPPRFEVYRAVSRQIHAIFGDYTALIEPLSLEEAYLDVSANLRGLPTASATAKEIRARILEETGLTASAGVSYNKFLAKLASGAMKIATYTANTANGVNSRLLFSSTDSTSALSGGSR